MLNNLTNFFNLIRGRKIKTTLADSDLIAIGVRDSRFDGNYQPSAIKYEDFAAQLGSSIQSYKVYAALLTQIGNDDPIVTVLENTIGNIVWTRNLAGNYEGTLTGAFTTAKTACILGNKGWSLSPNNIDPYDVTLDTFGSNNVVYLAVNNALGGQDGKLNNAFIEIRIYP